MNLTSAELLRSLPDFDDMMKVTEEIKTLFLRKLFCEKEIKSLEAEVIRTVVLDEKYRQGGKSPSMSFIESTYKYTGFNNEIIPMREELATLVAELEQKRTLFDIYKSMLDLWRTLSANERIGSLG